jgi:type II secretory pathway pseudopilin PulG
MRDRAGFTILEAAVATAMVGMISVGALAAFGADLRAAQKAQELLPASVLAEERMADLELADPARLRLLSDSLRRGSFTAGFERYEWSASATPVRDERWLFELVVRVQWENGEYVLNRRRFRPPPAGGP